MSNKSKQIISLNPIPNTILAVILIIGIGATAGLWAYKIFETDKNLSDTGNSYDCKNIRINDNHFGNEFIQVKTPQKNTTIKNPVLISGKANVFEANVRVRIKDDNKNVLTDTFITADGWMDKLYPFEKEISYSQPGSKNGVVEIFEESAKDGSDLHKIAIPIVFGNTE
jgi:hypothetical protein